MRRIYVAVLGLCLSACTSVATTDSSPSPIKILQKLTGQNGANLKFYERPSPGESDKALLRVYSSDARPLTVMLYDNLTCSNTGASGLLGAPGMKIEESLQRQDIPEYISMQGNTEKMVSPLLGEHSYIERVIPVGKPIIVQFIRTASDKVEVKGDDIAFNICAFGLKFEPKRGKQYQIDVGSVQHMGCSASITQFVPTSLRYKQVPEPYEPVQHDCQPT